MIYPHISVILFPSIVDRELLNYAKHNNEAWTLADVEEFLNG